MTRLNWSTQLRLPGCTLVPYRASHVPAYHAWMQSPALLAATASEPLSLEEELANQKSWRDDLRKMTFIIQRGSEPVGDVNLFLMDVDDDEKKDGASSGKHVPQKGEVEVMIAVESARRKGIAMQAVSAMILYAAAHLKLTDFLAKIGKDNAASLALFAKLKFKQVSFSEAFDEFTLESTGDTLPACRVALNLGDGGGLVEEKNLDVQIEGLREKGNLAFAAKDFTRACEIYDEALALDGRDATLRSNRSVSRLKLGEYFGAFSDAYLAQVFDPAFPKAKYRMAHALAFMGKHDAAIALFEQGARQFPEHAKAYREAQEQVEKNRTAPALSPPLIAAVTVSDLSAKWDVEIESASDARGVRFAVMSYIWAQLTGKERHAVYEEFSRAGFQDAAYIPSPEALEKAKAPKLPGQADEAVLSKSLREGILSLSKVHGPLARVAALSLVFESASRKDRAVAADVLIDMARNLV